jgi:hypothetical protein
VTNFVSDTATELPKYGLEQPAIKVTLSSYASENTPETKAGDKPIVSVHFGKVEGDSGYAKLDDEPFIVAAPKTLIEQIPTDAVQLQPVTIYSYKPEEITTLSVAREGQPAVAVEKQADGKWKLAKGDGDVNHDNANSIVNTLAKVSAVRWIGPTVPEHGLENPVITVTFTATQGDKKSNGKLTIGAMTGDSLSYAAAEGLTGTFAIGKPDRDTFDGLLIDKPDAAPTTSTAPAAGVPQPAAPAPMAPVPAPAQEKAEAVTPPVQVPPAPSAPAAAAAEKPAAPAKPATPEQPAAEKPAAEEKPATPEAPATGDKPASPAPEAAPANP